MKKKTKTRDDAGLIEYALLVVLIAVLGIASFRSVGEAIRNMFSDSEEEIAQTACGGRGCEELPPMCAGPFCP